MQNIDSEALITSIRESPAIWDSSIKAFKNKVTVKKSWDQIKLQFPGTEVEELKKRWKNIKDQYRKELKKYILNPDGEPLWRYFNHMDFIRSEVMKKGTTSDCKDDEVKEILPTLHHEIPIIKSAEIKEEIPEIVSIGSPTENINDVIEPESPKSSSSQQLHTMTKRKQTPHELREQYLEIEKKKLKLMEKEISKQNDSSHQSEDYHFLMSILPEIEKLPRIQKLRLRNKINSALMDEIVAAYYGNTTEISGNT